MYEYRIYESVYNDIICGKKTIEFRLLNEKSNKIIKGDIIKFRVVDSDKSIDVKVINKYLYEDIDDLYNHKEVLNNILGYNKEELTEKFYQIFGKENVINSKIVGIEFKLM